MSSPNRHYGVMKPLGGGDPIPLRKPELFIGRRPSCDIRLDFENVSGKHCVLRFQNQVWSVRDLGSTNGTRINGAVVTSEHTVMPDDELGIAGRLFSIDYEPGTPTSVVNQNQVMEEDVVETRKRTSLMELAGLSRDGEERSLRRPGKAAEGPNRPSVDEAAFEDALPDTVKRAPAPAALDASDDEFMRMIQESVSEPPRKP